MVKVMTPLLVALAACSHPAATTDDAPASADDAPLVDAGSGSGSGSGGGITPGPQPFTSAPGQWSWVDVPGMLCGNNTETGIGVNLSSTSNDIVVYFEGGGACWDVTTCFQTQTAIHIQDGYGSATFAGDENVFPFKRTDTGTPLATPTYIWIPYCTGDLHGGSNVATYSALGQTKNVSHVGATNAQAAVDRIVAAIPDAGHVWVTGSSAGGFGATLNFHRFTTAWPDAQIDLLQDSAPFVPLQANYGAWQAQWKLQFPPDCTGCTTDFRAVVKAVTADHPAARVGLLTYDDDAVIKLFFGYGVGDSLLPYINGLLADDYTAANTQAYVLVGTSHTMLGQLNADVSAAPGSVKLSDWVAQWASGSAAWTTVR
jgi:hypothetical protein